MKNLIKFSETMHNINESGILSIHINEENILKISPTDIISLFLIQWNSLPPNKNPISIENLMTFIEEMNIPQNVIKDIIDRIHNIKINQEIKLFD